MESSHPKVPCRPEIVFLRDNPTWKQLFADDYIIGEMDNVYRVMNRPVEYDGNPVLELNPDQKPGSKELIVVSGSVFYDEEECIFTMWYEGANYDWSNNVVCYATFKDGIHWRLPNLGLIEYNGSKENNIVFEKGIGEMAPGVMKDPATTDPRRQYKMIWWAGCLRVENSTDLVAILPGPI